MLRHRDPLPPWAFCRRCGLPGSHGGDGDACIEALRRAIDEHRGRKPYGDTDKNDRKDERRGRGLFSEDFEHITELEERLARGEHVGEIRGEWGGPGGAFVR